jgi:predicted PurR-regulated permease PerM
MTPADDPRAHIHPELSSPGPDGPAPRPADTAAPTERLRLFALAALTAVLIGLCVLLAVPFLPGITWGVALAIIAWPMHRWISRHIERPKLAAVLSSAVVVAVILGPGVFVTYQIAREAASAAERVQVDSGQGGLRETLAGIPGASQVMAWMDRVGLDVETEAHRIIASYTQELSSMVQGSVAAIVQFLVAVFLLYYLFVDRATFLYGLRDLLPLSRSESDQVFARAADSVHANLHATIVTSLIDSAGGGLMFWALGLPAPFLWTAVMFVLSLLPVVGAGLVWVPAVAYLALSGRWLAALALLAWGVLTFIIVDNIVYVRLAGERMRMHAVPALIAFLGGLAVFGVSGMILGPAILAVTVAFLEVWKRRLTGAGV